MSVQIINKVDNGIYGCPNSCKSLYDKAKIQDPLSFGSGLVWDKNICAGNIGEHFGKDSCLVS